MDFAGGVRRVGRAATGSRSLRVEVLAEIGRTVPFDAHVWLLTDPETAVGTEPVATVPPALMRDLPLLIRLKYATATNRWTSLTGAARLTTPGDSRMWRELLHAHGVTDVASMVFRDRHGCWGFLDLWRTGGVFTTPELALLSSVGDALTEDLRRCQAATFTARAAPRSAGPVVLLLTADLRVVEQTPQAHEHLMRMLPPGAGADPVPASAYNVAAQLLAGEAGVDGQPPWARVHLAEGRWLTLRAARLGAASRAAAVSRDAAAVDGTAAAAGAAAGGAAGHIAVTIEEASPAERTAVFARAFGLTPRETELLTLLTTGADTRAVAAAMFLSPNTVQDHLKSIFGKTASNSRRTLLSRALGTA